MSRRSTSAPSPAVAWTLIAASVGATIAALRVTRSLLAVPPPPGAVVLVTGGSRGLGFAIASRFAKGKVRLVLAAQKLDELQGAQTKLLAAHPHLRPEDFYLVACDLAEPDECRRVIDETFARFGRLDVLINNAGIMVVGPVEDQPAEQFERTMRVNFLAAMHTVIAALPRLEAQAPLAGWSRRAAIVNISSIGGKFSVPHMLPYSAAKFAMTGFSEGLHAEVRGKGIRVTTVCPGLMRTGGEAHANFVGNKKKEEQWFDWCATTPGVATTPEHAADRIFQAVAEGRAEITITPQAWLGARFAGVFPETLQWMNALVNHYVLPKP